MESEDEKSRWAIVVVLSLLYELVRGKCTLTVSEKFSHLLCVVCDDTEVYTESTHHEQFEYPSHVAVVVYYIRKDIYTFYFHVVILENFYKMQETRDS